MQDRKNEQPQKNKNRHQRAAMPLFIKQKSNPRAPEERTKAEKEEKPFTGMDIDRMNYTDI